MIYAHFFVANTINAGFLLQKWFEHTCFVAKTIYTHFFVTKTIYALFCHKKNLCILFLSRKLFTRFFCRKNHLRTSSGKFLRVESCHPESSDFLGLWSMHNSGYFRMWSDLFLFNHINADTPLSFISPSVHLFTCSVLLSRGDQAFRHSAHARIPCQRIFWSGPWLFRNSPRTCMKSPQQRHSHCPHKHHCQEHSAHS